MLRLTGVVRTLNAAIQDPRLDACARTEIDPVADQVQVLISEDEGAAHRAGDPCDALGVTEHWGQRRSGFV